jgi:undecaprenyl pyrophosphate phosphatase UppP
VILIDGRRRRGQAGSKKATAKQHRRAITMPAIIALVVAAIVAVAVLGFVLHILFSPWLLVVVAIVAWIKLRPRGSRQ